MNAVLPTIDTVISRVMACSNFLAKLLVFDALPFSRGLIYSGMLIFGLVSAL